MALTDSQQSACDSFGRLSIKNRDHMRALSTALYASTSTHLLAKQWFATWGRTAIRSAEEHALIRDIHKLAQYGDPDALAVVEQTIHTITINRIKS